MQPHKKNEVGPMRVFYVIQLTRLTSIHKWLQPSWIFMRQPTFQTEPFLHLQVDVASHIYGSQYLIYVSSYHAHSMHRGTGGQKLFPMSPLGSGTGDKTWHPAKGWLFSDWSFLCHSCCYCLCGKVGHKVVFKACFSFILSIICVLVLELIFF